MGPSYFHRPPPGQDLCLDRSLAGMEELLGVHVPPPRESFEIREVHVSSALRRDPLPGIDYSFNPYVGCYHGCTFCYVPRLLQIDRSAWGASVVVKRNAATVLAKELRRLPGDSSRSRPRRIRTNSSRGSIESRATRSRCS